MSVERMKKGIRSNIKMKFCRHIGDGRYIHVNTFVTILTNYNNNILKNKLTNYN